MPEGDAVEMDSLPETDSARNRHSRLAHPSRTERRSGRQAAFSGLTGERHSKPPVAARLPPSLRLPPAGPACREFPGRPPPARQVDHPSGSIPKKSW